MDFVSLLGQLSVSSPPIIASLLIGIATSISPCPLGSNVAAVALISKKAGSGKRAALLSLSYAAGRAATYVLVAALAALFGVAIAGIALPLQAYSELILSAVLLLSGLMLIGKIQVNFDALDSEKLRFLLEKGILGAFLLGAGLALVFCPVSAALFFGGVVPLVFSTKDWLFLPIAYGIGTAIPVIFFSPALPFAGKKLGSFSRFGNKITLALGWMLILAGVFYLLSFLRFNPLAG
ncbi:MAG: sulfite exporter TauE/SafE family protein [Candidatus Micrarchaeia archaeon]